MDTNVLKIKSIYLPFFEGFDRGFFDIDYALDNAVYLYNDYNGTDYKHKDFYARYDDYGNDFAKIAFRIIKEKVCNVIAVEFSTINFEVIEKDFTSGNLLANFEVSESTFEKIKEFYLKSEGHNKDANKEQILQEGIVNILESVGYSNEELFWDITDTGFEFYDYLIIESEEE